MSYFSKQIDEKVLEILKVGGVGLLPTDTIYGLSALALDKKAVKKIHDLKGRDGGKPLIVLIGDIGQLNDLGVASFNKTVLEEHWPAPLSIIFESNDVHQWLQLGTASLAVRFPDDDNLIRLMKEVGPIVSTSANLQGKKPAKTVLDARGYFDDKLDFYIDAGELKSLSSTLVKLEDDNFRIIREGAYKI